MLFSGGTEFWGGVGNKSLVGVGVYWGEFFQVGGGMSKFLAGVGGLPPSLPVGKTLSFIKIYIHHVTIIVIAIIIAFRVERIRNSCAQFFEHMLLRRSAQVCTMEKHASLLHLFRNWCTKSCTLNQPSLCTKHTNLLLFREI